MVDTNTQLGIALLSGYTDAKVNPEGDVVCIYKYAFTYAILSTLTPYGFEDRWCYSTYDKAKAALDAWDGSTGEPTGWHRHPKTGRRVDEDGKEYVNF